MLITDEVFEINKDIDEIPDISINLDRIEKKIKDEMNQYREITAYIIFN